MKYAVLFDFNGVIVDDEPIHFEAARRAVAERGFDLTEDEYFGTLFGLSDELFFKEFLRRRNIADADLELELAVHKSMIYSDLIVGVDILLPGVRELVSSLKDRAAVGIVSSAPKDEITAVLGRHELLDCFRLIVAADDIARHKPDPEGYNRALKELKSMGLVSDAAHVVAVEDSQVGISAAKAAGLKVIALAHYLGKSELRQADLIVNHISELSPEIIESLASGRPAP